MGRRRTELPAPVRRSGRSVLSALAVVCAVAFPGTALAGPVTDDRDSVANTHPSANPGDQAGDERR